MTLKVDVDAIVHAYQVEGKTLEEVGAQFGASICAVRDRLRKLGIARRSAGRKCKMFDPVRLVELRAAGLSHRELSFVFDTTRNVIRDKLAQLGLAGAM